MTTFLCFVSWVLFRVLFAMLNDGPEMYAPRKRGRLGYDDDEEDDFWDEAPTEWSHASEVDDSGSSVD